MSFYDRVVHDSLELKYILILVLVNKFNIKLKQPVVEFHAVVMCLKRQDLSNCIDLNFKSDLISIDTVSLTFFFVWESKKTYKSLTQRKYLNFCDHGQIK